MILRRRALRPLAALLTCCAAAVSTAPASAASCQDTQHDGTSYTICELRPAEDQIRLFLRNETGAILGSFGRINDQLSQGDETLTLAMNGGMYHSDRRPVGFYVEDGQQEMKVVPNAGPGNFGLLPNGIFCIGQTRAEVIETLRFLAQPRDCRHATQSGPMLVIDGDLHPRFLPDSSSRYIRNGVGSSADGSRVILAISNSPVTFHQFGRFFRDGLKLDQALYLDGKISRLYAPELDRNDLGFPMGPILGVVSPLGDREN